MKWNGKNYKPLLPQKIRFKEEKFDVEEYLQSLQEKHDRIPVWRSVIGVNVPVEEPIPPTPSITASPTPTPSITPSPTFTPTASVTPPPTSTPTNTPTPSASPLASGTTEALAYLETVVQTGGTVSVSASAATISFFTGLVSNGLWDKIYAFYPFLGGNSAPAQAIEGKLTYPIRSWNGGFTYNDDGVQGNGVNNYAPLDVSPDEMFGDGNPSSLGAFVNLQGTVGNRVYDMGANQATLAGQSNLAVRRVTGSVNEVLFDAGDYGTGNGRVNSTTTISSGFTIGTARSTTDRELYKNGLSIATKTLSANLNYTDRDFFLTAQNEDNTANWFNSNRYGFMFIGSGLTDTEVLNLSELVNDYQAALGRYSYTPSGITAANEFLERVVSSGGTVDATTSAATQTLFTDIVENYLWDKIDVFYPIIGGNAQGHMQGAGVRYSNRNNLAFNGGWTHNVSGMTPNGVNGYADTDYSPQNSATGGVNTPLCSLGAYVNGTGYTGAIMGAIDPETDVYQIRLRPGTNNIDPQPNTTIGGALATTLIDTTGMYIASRTGSTQTFVLQNNNITNLTQAQGSFNTLTPVYIGARNYGAAPEYGNDSIAFVFMGRDLTVSEATTLKGIVQTFQTSLSRNSV